MPGRRSKGSRIRGLDQAYDGVTVQHGATTHEAAGRIITAGGRVLYVTGAGEDVYTAS